MKPYIPERGDAVWLNFDPGSGHEQAGHRSAVVISPKSYNQKVGLALFCPVTSQVKQYPFEVQIPKGSKLKGVILSDQIKSLDWRARQASLIVKLPIDVVAEVISKVKLLL